MICVAARLEITHERHEKDVATRDLTQPSNLHTALETLISPLPSPLCISPVSSVTFAPHTSFDTARGVIDYVKLTLKHHRLGWHFEYISFQQCNRPSSPRPVTPGAPGSKAQCVQAYYTEVISTPETYHGRCAQNITKFSNVCSNVQTHLV